MASRAAPKEVVNIYLIVVPDLHHAPCRENLHRATPRFIQIIKNGCGTIKQLEEGPGQELPSARRLLLGKRGGGAATPEGRILSHMIARFLQLMECT